MKPWALILTVFFLFVSCPAIAMDGADSEAENEAATDGNTIDWLKSWGIKRNPDGSLQSMSPTELEDYWNELEMAETERRARRQKLESVAREQVAHDQEMISKSPNDPDIHYKVAINSRHRGDGEGAIIHMMKAEQLYKVQKDIRGLARSRKHLREFYNTYGYQPEDFDLTR